MIGGQMRVAAHHLRRSPAAQVYAAQEDKSWRSHGIDAAEKIAQASSICPYVGMQLEMKVAFALRPKEAMMIRPHGPNAGAAWR